MNAGSAASGGVVEEVVVEVRNMDILVVGSFRGCGGRGGGIGVEALDMWVLFIRGEWCGDV